MGECHPDSARLGTEVLCLFVDRSDTMVRARGYWEGVIMEDLRSRAKGGRDVVRALVVRRVSGPAAMTLAFVVLRRVHHSPGSVLCLVRLAMYAKRWDDGRLTCLVLMFNGQVCHANTIRSLITHLEGLGGAEVWAFDVPRAVPVVYELDQRGRILGGLAQGGEGLKARFLMPEGLSQVELNSRSPSNS
jgi:hypothetical protein